MRRLCSTAFVLAVAFPLFAITSSAIAAELDDGDLGARTETATLETSADTFLATADDTSTARGTVFVERPCSRVSRHEPLTVTMWEDDGTALTDGVSAFIPQNADKVSAKACPLALTAEIRRDASPSGWLAISTAGSKQTPLGMSATLPYKISRTCQFDDYLELMSALAGFGAIGAGVAALSVRRSQKKKDEGQDETIAYKPPISWTLKESSATTLAAVGSAGVGLLTSSGLLGEFLPDYRTGGAAAVCLIVAGLLVLAPITYTACRDKAGKPTQSSLIASVFFTAMGASTQVILGALVVLQAGLDKSALFGTWIAVLLILVLLLLYIYKSVLQTDESPATVA